jgi:uncharacterized protein
MVIDSHVRVDKDRYPIERALLALGEAKIGSAVIFADARAENIDAQNSYVLDVAGRHGLYPFYYLGGNPWTDSRPDELMVPDSLTDFAGIRWHRWVGSGIDRTGRLDRDELDWAIALMDSPDFEALMAAAVHYGMPVVFEESLGVTVEFVARYPSLDVIIPHLGARSGGELNVLRTLWDAVNVYFDASLTRVEEAMLNRLGSERILFGSSFPEGDPEREIGKIDDLTVSDEVKERIFGENLASLLVSYHAR